MRIVTIGRLAEEDISCTNSLFLGSHPSLPNLTSTKGALYSKKGFSDTLISEYIWSQIEPATAIVCACIVTYRPLFTTSLFESLASKIHTTTKRGQSNSTTATESMGSRSTIVHPMAWPVARDIFGKEREPDNHLFSEPRNGALQVLSIGEVARSLEEHRDGRTSPGAISVTRSFAVTRSWNVDICSSREIRGEQAKDKLCVQVTSAAQHERLRLVDLLLEGLFLRQAFPLASYV